MDLSSINPNTTVVDIISPSTGEPIGLAITLRAKYSPEVQAAQRKLQNDRLRTRSKNLTAEKLEAGAVDLMIAAIACWEWQGDATWDGTKPECTPAKVRDVLKRAPWIKSQLDDALENEALFFSN